MSKLLDSLKAGNWKSLLACFLYFDTGFTVWVMLGPLAPFISKQITMTPAEQGFLVAVPVLAAAILRVTFGNLFQSVNGRGLALMGIVLSSIPSIVLMLMPTVPSYTMLLLLGVFLGMGGASFAVALPMAGSSYPLKVQGLVLGLAAAGNIGAVLDGFLFPTLAAHFGWQKATVLALPLLAITAAAVYWLADDRSPKAGSSKAAYAAFVATFVALLGLILFVRAAGYGQEHFQELFGTFIVAIGITFLFRKKFRSALSTWMPLLCLGLLIVQMRDAGLFVSGKTALLSLPFLGALTAIAVLPQRYRSVFAERDTWVMMLVYSITFGGFVGMSSYVSLLLTTQYGISKVDAGLLMALFAFSGAMLRPVGGLVADRVTGVRALMVLLAVISLADLTFAAVMPGVAGGIAVLLVLYVCFGLGNGATFQLVPQRWQGKTGVMTGIIGAAGGIGGFYLPVIMGIAKESTGSYQAGFLTFGVIAALALGLVVLLRKQWLSWAAASHGASTDDAPLGSVVHAE
jgi:NNP family nitrate/nitrite transporter-like MFS transporter